MDTDTPDLHEGAGSPPADGAAAADESTDTDSNATADPAVTGPHAAADRYGRLDHYYFRCERCGLETNDAALRAGCWRCGISSSAGASPPAPPEAATDD